MKIGYFILISLVAMATSLQGQPDLKEAEVEINNESGINTEEVEFSPVFYKDGIVFITSQYEQSKYAITDTRIETNIFSIYSATRDVEGKLTDPIPFAKELLSTEHEGPVSFNSSGEVIYFTRNTKKETTVASNNYRLQLNIFSAQKLNDKWENISEMSFNESGYNTLHPSISPDMDELFFASDRPGGYGGYDLYFVRRIGGEWSSPINLGPQVNTPNNEVFPFIHADGTLYFSSDGHGGQGSQDIFYTNRNRDLWKRPINLGEPFNSSSDDLGLIIDRDNKNGYFSSSRSGGKGKDDVYNFSIKPSENAGKDEILVTVIDGASSESLQGATISYVNMNEVVLSDGQGVETLRLETLEGNDNEFIFKLNAGDDSNTGLTDEEGKAVFNLDDGQYALRVSNKGYLPTQITFTIPSNSNDNTFLIPLDKAVDCVPFSGTITAGAGTIQPGIKVIIKDVLTKEQFEVITDANGNYEYCLKCGREYEVYALKENTSSASVQVSTVNQPCNDQLVLNRDINLSSTLVNSGGGAGYDGYAANGDRVGGAPITEGTTILLPNIYFNFDDYALRSDARSDLDLVAKMLQLYPEMIVEIGSHTDSRGGEGYNQQLSEKRSKSATEYLISLGIGENRLTPVGYGETKPRNRCVNGTKCPERLHQENRRTEVRVISIGETISENTSDFSSVETLSEYVKENEPTTPTYQENNDGYGENTTSSFGQYLVIAGTFKSNNNASSRLSQVQEFGYSNAEIIKFDYPAYHAVCVAKFASEQEAKDLVRVLQSNHGINSYVRKAD